MPKIGIKVDNETNGIDLLNIDFLYHLVDFENNTESSKPNFNYFPIYLVALIDHSKKV